MKLADVVRRWYDGAEESWEVVIQLFTTKKYQFALFFLHLTLEKILKGLYLNKFSEPSSYTHDLKKLTVAIGVSLSEKELQELEEISSFNVSARYEEYKSMIYKKATREYTMKWIKI